MIEGVQGSPGLAPFLDAEGRFRRWPVKRARQLEALSALASEFEFARRYSEAEVNELLASLHTFGDTARLRRALCDWQFLARERDGSAYWLVTVDPPQQQRPERPDAPPG